MLKIRVNTIPHSQQRYETCGDYPLNNEQMTVVLVSDLGDWRMEACIAVHEIIEALIARHRGVKNSLIDDFDMLYESRRQPGDESEPGDDPACPVYEGHQIASGIERILAEKLGLDWRDYEARILELYKHP